MHQSGPITDIAVCPTGINDFRDCQAEKSAHLTGHSNLFTQLFPRWQVLTLHYKHQADPKSHISMSIWRFHTILKTFVFGRKNGLPILMRTVQTYEGINHLM